MNHCKEISWLAALDRWKVPFLFVSAAAGAALALPVIRQAAYDAALRSCVEKHIQASQSPVVEQLKKVNESLEYLVVYQSMSTPFDTLKKYNEIVASFRKANGGIR